MVENTVKKSAALLLLPNLLGDSRHPEVFFPSSVLKAVSTIDGLIAESEGEGRRYLSRFETKKPAKEIPIALFDHKTLDSDIDFYLEPIEKNQERWGLISDAGLPCIADPGSRLVRRARQKGISVQAFVGPSSIFLALMQSGLPGQKFSFLGYLDKSSELLKKQMPSLIKNAEKEKSTQIFIEAPHRNRHTLEALLEVLPDNFYLCVAWDLTLPSQVILSQPVQHWKKSPLPNIEKKPAIFLFSAY